MHLKTENITLCLAVLLLLAAAVSYWFGPDRQSNYQSNIDAIRSLQQLDSQWSIATLRAQSAIASGVDETAGILSQVRGYKKALIESELGSTLVPSALNNQLFAFLSLLDAKEEAVEAFKSNLAVMRSAIKHLPIASQVLVDSAQKNGYFVLSQQAESISVALQRYLQSPSQEGQSDIRQRLLSLREHSVSYPPEQANPVANMLSHIEVLLDKKIPTDQLLERATSNAATKEAAQLIEMYRGFEQHRRSEREIFAWVPYGIIFVLFILLLVSRACSVLAKSRWKESEHNKQNAPLDNMTPLVQVQDQNALPDYLLQDYSLPVEDSPLPDESDKPDKPDKPGEPGEPYELDEPYEPGESGQPDEPGEPDDLDGLNESGELDELDALDISVDLDGDEAEPELESAPEADKHAVSKYFNVNENIEQALQILDSTIQPYALIRKVIEPLEDLQGSPDDMLEIWINLLSNAVEAIQRADRGTKGMIAIDTCEKDGYIDVLIRDNGIGMAEDLGDEIFQPSYTTKQEEGAGMGLTWVQQVVDNYNGKIVYKSIAGKGSAFKVSLPLDEVSASG